MRQGIVKKWTEALRSGKFTQTDGKLYNPRANEGEGGYCCLGVLLEVASPFDWDERSRYWVTSDEEMVEHYNQWVYDCTPEAYEGEDKQQIWLEDEEFPEWLRNWFGMDSTQQGRFIEMNDHLGADFPQIADEIESTYNN